MSRELRNGGIGKTLSGGSLHRNMKSEKLAANGQSDMLRKRPFCVTGMSRGFDEDIRVLYTKT